MEVQNYFNNNKILKKQLSIFWMSKCKNAVKVFATIAFGANERLLTNDFLSTSETPT